MPASPAEVMEDANPKIPLDLISLCQPFFLMDTQGRKTWAWQFGFCHRTTGVWAAFTSAMPWVPREESIPLCVSVMSPNTSRHGGVAEGVQAQPAPVQNSPCKLP